MSLRIERIVVRRLALRLRWPFASAGGTTVERPILLVHVDGPGVSGVGECVAFETPHYSPETIRTAAWMLERHLAPAVLGRAFGSAAEVSGLLDRTARGHPMAKAALEMAVWDAEARARDRPLASLLGGTRTSVEAGVVVGLAEDPDALLDRIEARLAEGYRRIKLKIEPGRDRRPLGAVRARYPDLDLTADANGAYGPDDSPALGDLDAFGLGYLEQPFAPDALAAHAALRGRVTTPICLDESIDTPGRCRDALALGACDVVNIKPGRVGGHGPAREIHDLCADAGLPVWCGGMLESGVGRAHNVALASLPNMSLPGDLSASDRYWERDIVVPAFTVDGEGRVEVPRRPGIGVELDEDYIRSIEASRVELH
jgi:O-succinylbenzoate synthase